MPGCAVPAGYHRSPRTEEADITARLWRDHSTLIAALAVGAVAVIARLPGALEYPLWQDEVASARVLEEPTPGRVLDRVEQTESTPPAWYLVGWLVHRAGVSLEGVRMLSVLAGGALAALLIAYARRLLPLWPAAAAGLLVALGAHFVTRGHELRAYALFALVSLAFALLLEAAAAAPTGRRLLGLAACVALGLLTHYFFALVVLTGLVWVLTSRSLEGSRWRLTSAFALGIVPFLLWLPGFVGQYGNELFSRISDFDLLKAGSVYSTFFSNAGPLYVRTQDVELGVAEALGRVAVLVLVLAGAAVLARRSERGRLTALLAVLPVATAAILWLAGANVFTTRNLLCSGPFAAVAIIAALAALPRRAAVTATAASLGLVAAGLVQERALAPPAYDRLAGALVSEGWRLGDPVAVFGNGHEHSYFGSIYALRSPVAWYLPGHPQLLLPSEPGLPCESAYVVAPAGEGASVLREGLVAETAVVQAITVARLPCAPGLEGRLVDDGAIWFASRPAS